MIYKIPNLLSQNKNVYLPSYLAGFTHFIYINLSDLLTTGIGDTFTVGLFNKKGVEVQVVGNASKDTIITVSTSPYFRLYFNFTPDLTIRGEHFLGIYKSDNTAVYQSNLFDVIGIESVEDYVYCQYRNSSNRDGFNYVDFTEYQTVFLDINQINDQFEYDKKGYTEESTGLYRGQRTLTKKAITLETHLFDEGARDAMASLSDHDDILINQVSVTAKEGHQASVNRDFDLANGIITFYVNDYSTVNYNN
jgi:hypothetical protein